MRVLFQPTQASPKDWLSVESTDWSRLRLPSANMHALCVQGVVYEGADHYAIRNLPSGGIKVFLWYDDPDDWPVGQRWARVATVPKLGPDAALGGAINTLSRDVIFAEGGIRPTFDAAYARSSRVTVRDWSEFVPPQANTFWGAWVTNAHHEAHQRIRSTRGWREWTEGLDPSQLDAQGKLKQQRVNVRFLPPDGTRTYYHNPAAGPNIHTAQNPNSFGTTATGSTNETAVAINQNGDTAFSATTQLGEPNSAAWPTTGIYRYQLDVVSVGADLNFGLLDQGAGQGHFGRVDFNATADLEKFAQDEGAFSGSGLHLATITNPAWTAGNALDRFEVVISAMRVSGHGNQDMTMQVGETDDFADGPWPSGAVAENAVFFGAMF